MNSIKNGADALWIGARIIGLDVARLGSLAKPVAQVLIIEQPSQGVRQAIDIAGLNEKSCQPILNDFGERPHGRAHNGQTKGHGLQN